MTMVISLPAIRDQPNAADVASINQVPNRDFRTTAAQTAPAPHRKQECHALQ